MNKWNDLERFTGKGFRSKDYMVSISKRGVICFNASFRRYLEPKAWIGGVTLYYSRANYAIVFSFGTRDAHNLKTHVRNNVVIAGKSFFNYFNRIVRLED